MLKTLRVSNFKSLAESGRIEIRPITLLVGANSSGKSSVIQALLTLKQTVENRDPYTPLVTNGSYARLGSYTDFIFSHNPRAELSLSIEFDYSDVFTSPTRSSSGRRSYREKRQLVSAELHSTFKYRPTKRDIILGGSRLKVTTDGSTTLVLDVRRAGRSYEAIVEYPSKKDKDILERKEFRRVRAYRFYSFRPPPSSLRTLIDFPFRRTMVRTERCLDDIFDDLYYLGPLRQPPRRFYVVGGETRKDVGLAGEFAVDVLWIRSQAKKRQQVILRKVNEWIKEFGMGKNVELKLTGVLQALIVDSERESLKLNLADVGFGVSQILPVIVQAFYSSPGSILILEQPEIHLHPDVQARLADLLIEAARERTLIVETHSEHILARLRRRVADGSLLPNNIAVYYFKKGVEGTHIRRLDIDATGQLSEWPDGFFEEDFFEAIEHIKAIVTKKARQGE